MRYGGIIWIVLLVFSSKIVLAQKQWTLEECISYAVQNNLNLKESQLQNEINNENYNQSIRDLLPNTNFGTNSNFYFGKSIDPVTNDYVNTQFFSSSYRLNASADLFSGFTKLNYIKFRRLNYLAGVEDERHQKNEVAFNVMSAYFDVHFYDGLIDIAVEQKKLSELNLKHTLALVKTGLKAKADILEMESRMAAEELYVIQTRNSYQTALLSLKQAMNLETGEQLVLKDFPVMSIISKLSVSDSDSIFAVALRHHPIIKAQDIRKQAAKRNLSIARGRLMPTIGIYGGYASNYSAVKVAEYTIPFNDQLKNNLSQNMGVSLNIPLFHRWSIRSDVKLAKLSLVQAETNYEIANHELYYEIEQNYQDLFALFTEYGQAVKQYEAAEIAYRAAEKKLEQGIVSTIEFYDSKNLMAQSKSSVLRIKLQYEFKKRTIDFFMGIPLYSENR